MKYYHNKNDAGSEKLNTIRSSLIIEHQSKKHSQIEVGNGKTKSNKPDK